METIAHIIQQFSNLAWGLPLVALLVGGGIYFMFLSRLTPYRYVGHAFTLLTKQNDTGEVGDINQIQSLSTALSSTIGMGNIAGVAVAISIGGPGAIFWMWISGIIGMCTKFFTGSLSIMYRGQDNKGKWQGGPMYFITEGMGKKWKPLAQFFALAGLVGALPVLNVNQLTQAIRDIVLKPEGLYHGVSSDFMVGTLLVALTATVILGGIKRIGSVAERLVPFMVILYLGSVLYILITHADKVGYYLKLIFSEAFAPTFFTGEAFLGGSLGGLIILGIRRGAFSNEAGIGTAPMAHGASIVDEPIKEGLVAMLGPLIDTLVVCTLTALAILVTDAWQIADVDGVTMTAEAFGTAIDSGGRYLLLLIIMIFSLSSLFSFSYYGTKCMAFLFGTEHGRWYNYVYLLSILIGATTSLDMMLNLIDGFYALMAIPTMIASLWLAPKVVARAKRYFATLSSSAT